MTEKAVSIPEQLKRLKVVMHQIEKAREETGLIIILDEPQPEWLTLGQKRLQVQNTERRVDEDGHEVWIKSLGFWSYIQKRT